MCWHFCFWVAGFLNLRKQSKPSIPHTPMNVLGDFLWWWNPGHWQKQNTERCEPFISGWFLLLPKGLLTWGDRWRPLPGVMRSTPGCLAFATTFVISLLASQLSVSSWRPAWMLPGWGVRDSGQQTSLFITQAGERERKEKGREMESSMTEFWLIARLDSDECGKQKSEGEMSWRWGE